MPDAAGLLQLEPVGGYQERGQVHLPSRVRWLGRAMRSMEGTGESRQSPEGTPSSLPLVHLLAPSEPDARPRPTQGAFAVDCSVPISRLADQIQQVLPVFSELETPLALIDGLAQAAHKVIRAAGNVDFRVAAVDADRVHGLLLTLGYRCVHCSADAANYLRGDKGFGLLYAHRPVAADLLRRAQPRDTPLGRMRVISAEGLIGFKLQALHNDPSRHRDLDDIRQLLRANRGQLDLAEVRRCFQLFEREVLPDELLADLD